MPRSGLRRLVALALFASWLAPGAGAVAASLHLGTGHHHDDELATDLAMGVVHGHSHGVAEPTHEHPAADPGGSQALSWPSAIGVTVLAGPAVPPPAPPATPPTLARRPPPEPLLYSHCALLL